MQESSSLDPFSENSGLRDPGFRGRLMAFFRRYHGPLCMLLACAWTLLFYRMSFNFTERFFQIPLLLLSFPVLLGLAQPGAVRAVFRSPLLWAVLLLAAAGCIAGAVSPFAAPRSYKHIVLGWLVLTLGGITMKLALPDKALRLLLLGLVAGLLASAVWAVSAEIFGVSGKEIMLADKRFFFYTGYPATLGLMAGYALIGQVHFWKHGRYLLSKYFDIAMMLGVACLLIMSQARIALLATLASLAVMVLRSSRRPWRAAAVMTLAAFLSLSGAVLLGQHTPLRDSAGYQRMIVLFTNPMRDLSVVGRLGLWEISWEVIKERPLTGSGMRMFGAMREQYLREHKEELLAKYDFVEEGGPHAHNIALGVLSEMGILGFLPLLLIVLLVLRNAARTLPGSDKECLLLIFVYFFCQGCVDYMLNKILYSNLLFASIGLFAGVLCSLPGRAEQAAQDSHDTVRA